MEVLAVGGEPRFVKEVLGPRYSAHGITIRWHWEWGLSRPGDRLPAGCQGVVVFRDMVGHNLSDAAIGLAAAADVPCAAVPRKMAMALPILQSVGLTATQKKVEEPEEAVILDVLQNLVSDEIRLRNRQPSKDEARELLSRVLGHSPDPFPDALFAKAKALVAATKTPDERLPAWIELALEEHFEAENNEIAARVTQLVTEDGGSRPNQRALLTQIRKTRVAMRQAWSRDPSARNLGDAVAAWKFRHPEGTEAEIRGVFGVLPTKETRMLEGSVEEMVEPEIPAIWIRDGINKARLISAGETASTALQGLSEAERLAVGNWLFHTRGKGTPPTDLMGLVDPLVFATFLAHCIPSGSLPRVLIPAAYRSVFGRKMGVSAVDAVAWALGREVKDDVPTPNVLKQVGRVSADTEVVERLRSEVETFRARTLELERRAHEAIDRAEQQVRLNEAQMADVRVEMTSMQAEIDSLRSERDAARRELEQLRMQPAAGGDTLCALIDAGYEVRISRKRA